MKNDFGGYSNASSYHCLHRRMPCLLRHRRNCCQRTDVGGAGAPTCRLSDRAPRRIGQPDQLRQGRGSARLCAPRSRQLRAYGPGRSGGDADARCSASLLRWRWLVAEHHQRHPRHYARYCNNPRCGAVRQARRGFFRTRDLPADHGRGADRSGCGGPSAVGHAPGAAHGAA